eukprot:7381274-Prymnesium_polylepis.3
MTAPIFVWNRPRSSPRARARAQGPSGPPAPCPRSGARGPWRWRGGPQGGDADEERSDRGPGEQDKHAVAAPQAAELSTVEVDVVLVELIGSLVDVTERKVTPNMSTAHTSICENWLFRCSHTSRSASLAIPISPVLSAEKWCSFDMACTVQ